MQSIRTATIHRNPRVPGSNKAEHSTEYTEYGVTRKHASGQLRRRYEYLDIRSLHIIRHSSILSFNQNRLRRSTDSKPHPHKTRLETRTHSRSTKVRAFTLTEQLQSTKYRALPEPNLLLVPFPFPFPQPPSPQNPDLDKRC